MEYVPFAGHGEATSRGGSLVCVSACGSAAPPIPAITLATSTAMPIQGGQQQGPRQFWLGVVYGLAIYGLTPLAGLLLILSYATAAMMGDAARQTFVDLGGLLRGLVALVLPLSIYLYRRRKTHRQS
jgi:hypothetical protein